MLVTNRVEFVTVDRILLIDGGSPVADGTYKELINSNEAFQNLMAGVADIAEADESEEAKKDEEVKASTKSSHEARNKIWEPQRQ